MPAAAWKPLPSIGRRGAEGTFDTLDMPALLNALIASGAPIEVLYVHGHWRGVNDLDDLRQAVDLEMKARLMQHIGVRAGVD